MARVDWQAAVAALEAGRLPCSNREGQLLRVAASIAEGRRLDLRDALAGLERRNLIVFTTAVLHAGGHHDAAVWLDQGVGR